MRITATVNGQPRQADDVWPGESLLFVLRERMGLPGSKNACEQGECGSCTVYLDGVLVCACLVAAGQAQGASVVTVEGLAAGSPERAGGMPAPPGPRSAATREGGALQASRRRAGSGSTALHPVQEAFVAAGAVQCGFCTPGLVVAAHDLLARVPQPSDPEIREALAGNLCRCTGYEKILTAVHLAADQLATEGDAPPRADRQPDAGEAGAAS
jgi:aerobic carbon-monoxide dehydrogenase small subunit